MKDRYINRFEGGGIISGWDTQEEALEHAALLAGKTPNSKPIVTYRAIAKTEHEQPPVKVTRL